MPDSDSPLLKEKLGRAEDVSKYLDIDLAASTCRKSGKTTSSVDLKWAKLLVG
jgi:hypothetical protein